MSQLNFSEPLTRVTTADQAVCRRPRLFAIHRDIRRDGRATIAAQAIAVLGLTISAAASAHHSVRAFYDRDSSVEIEGTVTSISLRNPHVGVTVMVRNAQGEDEEWRLEGGAMNTLQRRGFTSDSVAVGDHVRAAGSPSIRGENSLYVTNFLLPSGREVLFTDRETPFLWTGADGATTEYVEAIASGLTAGQEPVPDIFRVWTAGESYRLRAPLELTAAARTARSTWNPAVDDPSLRCEAPGMPNAILNPYPIEFIDEGGRIRLKIEEWDSVRTIYLVDGDHPDARTSGRLGYSHGHWDGDTLIVETSDVDAPYLDDSGTPMSADVEMLERFNLDRARGRLTYEVTVTDPKNLAEPAVWEANWVWVPGVQVHPYRCATR